MKKSISLLLAFVATVTMSLTASAEITETTEDEESDLLDLTTFNAEYCESHTYRQRTGLYYTVFEQDDDLGEDYFFSEEEYLRIKAGENAIIMIDYDLYDGRLYYIVKEPGYRFSFLFVFENVKREVSPYRLDERNVFTIKEAMLDAGVADRSEEILLAGYINSVREVSGYNLKGYRFYPCQNGWNEIDGEKYYVKKDGTLATKSATIDGVRYRFDAGGRCLGTYSGWTSSAKGRRYWYNGKMLADKTFKASGVKYRADKDGYVTPVE
ncbi:MAG: hypothetical protein NC084_13370 [Bacteroides sp.]|nr:hypothetical protein [Eubacterium sp.]MCM1419689.1 hypothetical protein [Roseburia sp.]MCM1463687.1 hypothetical protein [Bacteroides sp.]